LERPEREPKHKKTAAALTADEALANAALEGRLVDVTALLVLARACTAVSA
jgi:hypothetical protein